MRSHARLHSPPPQSPNTRQFYDATPETSRLFYEFLLGLGSDFGATMFEPDFLNANHLCVRRHIEEVGAADAFFDGQASVALARGIPIQWCELIRYRRRVLSARRASANESAHRYIGARPVTESPTHPPTHPPTGCTGASRRLCCSCGR